MDAVVFCGIQGSGKTTFYRQRFFHTHIRISLAMLKTRAREERIVRACVEARQPFVVDNTNPTRAERRRYLEAAAAGDFVTRAFFFEISPRAAIGRNFERPKDERIPAYAVMRTFKRLEVPKPEEGWHEVMRVRPGPEGSFIVEALEGAP
jgi:predicted kinase